MVINPIVGFYIPIIRIPIKGGMTIPNTRSLDPGSCVLSGRFAKMQQSKVTCTSSWLAKWILKPIWVLCRCLFLELTCRWWTRIIGLKICCPVLYIYILCIYSYICITDDGNVFVYIYIYVYLIYPLGKFRLFLFTSCKKPDTFHPSDALRRACCLARFLAKGPWEHTCNGTPRHVRGLLRWGARTYDGTLPTKNEHD